jgi:hypothetical protein
VHRRAGTVPDADASYDPGSAKQRFTLHRARETGKAFGEIKRGEMLSAFPGRGAAASPQAMVVRRRPGTPVCRRDPLNVDDLGFQR